jgi:signal peptidase I
MIGPLILVWWIRHRYTVVTVRGDSMRPTYRPGDRLLVRRGTVHRGQCVVFAEPPDGWIVKRVLATSGDPVPPGLPAVTGSHVPPGCLVVVGDDPDRSYDSRHFGYVTGDRVRGVVLRRL